eukprot:5088253-Prymnesium_polylepis.2
MAVRVAGLHAATRYEGFGVIACSTAEATSCAALHPAECSPPAKGAPVHTAQPPVEGNVNNGTHDGGGWVLVRRVAPGDRWHPATDNLTGTEEYGDPDCEAIAACTFSRSFKDVAWKEVLFASGDTTRWLQLDRSWLWLHGRQRSPGEPIPVTVSKSHLHTLAYPAHMQMRSSHAQDPLVRTDLRPTARDPLLYAEASLLTESDADLVAHNGANVWVRPWVPTVSPLFGSPSARGRGRQRQNDVRRRSGGFGGSTRSGRGDGGMGQGEKDEGDAACEAAAPLVTALGSTAPRLPSLEEIVIAMRRCPHNVDVQHEAVKAIERAAEAAPADDDKDETRALLAHNGALEQLVRLLDDETTGATLVSKGLRALLKVLRNTVAVEFVLSDGGYAAVYHVLQRHHVAEVHERGLAVLWALGRRRPAHASELLATGAALVAEEAKALFPRDKGVSGWAALLRGVLHAAKHT